MRESEGGMRIGSLAREVGIPGRRIRFYEERGLISPASRSEAGYRLYGEREVARLEFIKQSKTLGLTLKEIKALITVADGCDQTEIAHHLEAVLQEKLRQTRQKIAELTAFERDLGHFIGRAEALERGEIQSRCTAEEPDEFCDCLHAVTDMPEKEVNMDRNNAPCACACECCNDAEQTCGCACECCAECA